MLVVTQSPDEGTRMLTPQNSHSKTILIVEDEPDTAEMLGEMLRLSGYDTLFAYDGRTALEMLRSSRPEAIILDVLLPGLTGLEVLRSIRNHATLETTPVVLVSGNSHPRDIQAGLMAGASLYLTKPLDFWELKEGLERLMRDRTTGYRPSLS
jgi:DNA-binding response OmpR family regulator